MKYEFAADRDGLAEALKVIEDDLKRYKLAHKDVGRNVLVAEEVILTLLAHSEKAEKMCLSIRRFLDEVSIEISVPGTEFPFEKELDLGTNVFADDIGPDTEIAIRGMILKSFADDLKYRCRAGMNTVRIIVIKSKRAALYRTVAALVLGAILGLLLKNFVPESIYLPLNDNLLIPVKTMYMNALKMIVAPVVFFSIVSCIGQFSDLSELGKIGGKTISLYGLTTVISTLLGTGVFYLFRPGEPGSFTLGADVVPSEVQTADYSFKNMLVNVVPDNFLKPFLQNDMLQLIFLAVLCGIAVGMIGKYSRVLRDLFTACNEWFLKITSLIIKCIPIAVFCSFLSMMLTMGTDTLSSVLGIVGVFFVAMVLLMGVYAALILIFARLNPIKFCKKYIPTMAQVFSLGSSNASLPLNMEACKKLGVSQNVYSLSLPLGATVNMDGICIHLSIFALALARICGVEVSPVTLISVLVSIIVLSLGAPGIPGSGMICLSVILGQLNVPIEVIALIMGIDPIIGMIRCMVNCLGDVAVTTVVAKQEGLLDIDTYNSK